MVAKSVKASHSSNTSQNTASYAFNENLNVDFLTKTYINNLGFCEKMFGIFLTTIEADMSNLKLAIGLQDFEVVESVAHKIKNNFTWVGLPRLSTKMYSMENMAREKSLELNDAYEELIGSYASDLKYVESEYANLKAFVSE